jgi:hypothetical protein
MFVVLSRTVVFTVDRTRANCVNVINCVIINCRFLQLQRID